MDMAAGFMPHGSCFLWQPDVLWLHVVSDALIALAYFSIPVALLMLVRRRPDLPFSAMFWMFSIFIVSCGTTHILSIVVIWHPIYWIEGFVKAITAVSSVSTAILLVGLLPRALNLRSPVDLEHLNARLQKTLDESDQLLRRYEREHYIATTFQSASLTDIPQSIGALEISAVYRPGVGDLEIGGDWYDAFQLPDGRVVISIGDVSGKGLTASVIMSKMRQAIRVAAQVQVEPSAILDAADKSLRLEYPDHIVTAFVGIIDDVDAMLSYANAGHPLPMMRSPEGTISELIGGGLPLGLRVRVDIPENHLVSLDPGAMLVLFTDGLTESTHDYEEGERRLRDALQRQAVALAPNPAREIQDAVLLEGIRDDVAILTLRIGSAEHGGERFVFDVMDDAAAHRARLTIMQTMRDQGATDEELFASELIYGELIGNVVRYAPGTVDIRLDWETGAPVLHVLDNGPGFQYVPGLPSDIMAESGRGLFLVYRMTSEFNVLKRPHGGSHARAVLPLVRRGAALVSR